MDRRGLKLGAKEMGLTYVFDEVEMVVVPIDGLSSCVFDEGVGKRQAKEPGDLAFFVGVAGHFRLL